MLRTILCYVITHKEIISTARHGRVRYLAGHYVISSSIRFPGDNRDFGYSGFSIGVKQLCTVPDDAAVLLLLSLGWKACTVDGVTKIEL